MEPLRDLTWMRYLLTGPPAEKVRRAGYEAAFVAVPKTRERHQERYRYRAFIFESSARTPSLAVNLESDILGEYLLTVEDAQTREVLARYDRELSYEDFRTRALDEASRRMNAARARPKHPAKGRGADAPKHKKTRKSDAP